MRSVTRLAVRMAEEMADLFPDFCYGRDILIAGCLCHDIGKVWEFDPANVKRWKAAPRAAGKPSLRHPAYGVHICLTLGLPEEVAHCAAAHSGEGELVLRSLENTILHQADYTFWRVAEAGAKIEEPCRQPRVDGAQEELRGRRARAKEDGRSERERDTGPAVLCHHRLFLTADRWARSAFSSGGRTFRNIASRVRS